MLEYSNIVSITRWITLVAGNVIRKLAFLVLNVSVIPHTARSIDFLRNIAVLMILDALEKNVWQERMS